MGADAPQPKGLTSLVAHKGLRCSALQLVSADLRAAGSVRCLVYCARTNCLVSGSFDNTLAVWQIGAPGQVWHQLSCISAAYIAYACAVQEKATKFMGMLLGHNSRVKSAAFSAGLELAAAMR